MVTCSEILAICPLSWKGNNQPRVEFPSFLDKEEVLQSQRPYDTMMKNLWKSYPSLLEKYRDQWILWDGERAVHTCDTGPEMLQHIRENNINTRHMEIDYIETNPRRMIL